MTFSINGIGTTWYGSADKEPDGSYVVTEWIIFVFIPLIPLGSKRVWPAEEEDRSWWKPPGEKFNVARVPLHIPHILKGYAVTLGLFIIFRFA